MARVKNISDFMSSLQFLIAFFADFLKRVEKLGVSAEELYKALNSAEKRQAMAQACAGVLKNVPQRILKHLILVKEHISVSTKSFSKQEFLNSKLGVKMYQWDNFKSWIVPEISEEIPAFSINLTSYKLTKNMYDREIRTEIGEDQVFTPDEVLAIIFANISKQSNGEVGDLENSGYANIFYVRLKSEEVVAVDADWHAGGRGWGLGAHRLGDGRWDGDNRVFGRS